MLVIWRFFFFYPLFISSFFFIFTSIYLTFYLSFFLFFQILDALFAKARHYATIGDFDEAYKSYDDILTLKKISSGKKIDATLDKMRVAFFTLVFSRSIK